MPKAQVKIKKEDGTEISEEEFEKEALTVISAEWEQYKENIAKAIANVKFLLDTYGKKKMPAVLRLLSQEPMNKWHRLRRILS